MATDYTKEQLEDLEKQLTTQKELVRTTKQLKEAKEELAKAQRDLNELLLEADEQGRSDLKEQFLKDNKTEIDQLNQKIALKNKEIKKNAEARVVIKELNEQIAEVNRLRRLNNQDIKDEIDSLEKSILKRQSEITTLTDVNEQLEEKIKLSKEQAKLAQKQLTLDEKTNNLSAEERRNARKAQKSATAETQRLEKLQDLLGDTDEQAKITKEGLAEVFSSLARGDIGGAVKGGTKLKDLFGQLSEGGVSMGDAFKGMKGQLMSALGPAAFAAIGAAVSGALFKITKASFDLVVQLSDLEKSVMKATGGSQEFASVMTKSFMETRKFAGTAEEAAKAQTALSQTFTDFTRLGADTQQQLVQTGALLQRLGVDAGATAQNTQLMVKSLGMTAEEAGRANLRLAALGQDLGMDPAQLAKDFGSAGGQLAKLGSNGEAAFKRLAVASKATGLEIGKILNMVEKFDTFEGAAEQAGKLNAALGGNFVNAMELMTATDPVDRFNTIRDSILDAGLAFDDMSYYQRKFFTQAAGLSDVSELAMMMSGDMDALSGDVGKTSADYADMAERARELASFQELLKSSFQQLIPVLTPVVKKFAELTGTFFEFITENGEMIYRVLQITAGVIVAIGVGLAFLAGPVWAVVGGVTALVTGLSLLASLVFETAFNPPNFFQGMKEMSNDFGDMSVNINKSTKTMHSFGNEVVATGNKTYRQTQLTKKAMPEVMQMTNTSMTNEIKKNEINNAMLGSSTATTNAISSAVKNSTNNTTVNNNGQGGGETGISIKFDNKKFADLFDVQVEKSIGRAARKAVI